MQRLLSLAAVGYTADARLGEQVANANHPFGPCERQAVFDVMMCTSYMCNDCVLEYCTEKCQWVQQEFAGCVCQDWPASRVSFSGGEFAGKGRFGDKSDYAHAGFRSRNTYGDDHTAQGIRDGSDAMVGMNAYDWTPEGIYAAANNLPWPPEEVHAAHA